MSGTEEFVYQAVQNGEIEIDSEGRIWRVAIRYWFRNLGRTKLTPCRRRQVVRKCGDYILVSSEIAGEKHLTSAQRLVWRHFFGPIPDGLTVNHKNGIKKDNEPKNLELATHSEQSLHAVRVLGWRPELNVRGKQIGADNGRAKLGLREVAAIRKSKKVCRVLAAKYGVSLAAISKVRTGRTWAA